MHARKRYGKEGEGEKRREEKKGEEERKKRGMRG